MLALEGVSKSFGAVPALRDVSLRLYAGEAHALAGENGAGKSTLDQISRRRAPSGHRNGPPRRRAGGLHSPADARDAGIAVIYQEPTLFPTCPSRRTSSSDDSPGAPWAG
ncbi:ATP-binding cassette domain-containing protein [Streptomyces thinghirensis]|nr:ATP-binding cassette domain-containing protein [Streptomyces thinghirensis]